MLSEPLTLLVLLAAMTLAVLAPAFHYHQFGDPTRMARDAGFSALFVGGSVLAIFGTIRTFRREIESGTLEMALTYPVSRVALFLSKTIGAFLAYLIFVGSVFGAVSVICLGAELGGAIARRTGDIARLYGPCLAGGIGILLLPLVIAAFLNRFARRRFVLSCILGVFVLSFVGLGVTVFLWSSFILRLVPVIFLLMFPTAVLLTVAASFSLRLKANVSASCAGIVFALMVPAIGNYYMVDALSGGGTLPWDYVGTAALVTLPAIIAFLLLGIHLMNGRDIQWTR